MKKVWIVVAIVVVIAVPAGAYLAYLAWWHLNYYEVEYTDYNDPPDKLKFVDDKLAEKNPAWDESFVDSRPIGDWELNASAAVTKLDCPSLKEDHDAALLELRASYAAAAKAAKDQGLEMLPSANLLDGAAKQFDDGLVAALDLACYRGELGAAPFGAPAAPKFIRAVFDALPNESPARPFLAAALELAGDMVPLPAEQGARREILLALFERDTVRSQPIGFYTWTKELGDVWRFFRFLQHEFDQRDLGVPRDIAAVLAADSELAAQYAAINGFYSRLTNPLSCLPASALAGTTDDLPTLAQRLGARRATVAVFPPSTSRETELFSSAFPMGLPAGANLMSALIERIKSGEVMLAPRADDGWYQHQVYALETLLLPSAGQERDKLLLTAAYKERLVEAFKALLTKRRETHARQLEFGVGAAAPPGPSEVRPRLRVEPCSTYYLRTARAYGFLEDFLTAAVGRESLAKLHGLKQGGTREANLADELAAMRLRSYGFYFVSCEDIGMKPQLADGEPVDQAAAMKAALDWLAQTESDEDLACDTRVSVPIYVDPIANKTRLWATLGVRLARLEASYARGPKIRPRGEGGEVGEWKDAERYQLGTSDYVIAVDEFAEIELAGLRSLTREQLRATCDEQKTKERIVEALSK
jgi:hypothetical protein